MSEGRILRPTVLIAALAAATLGAAPSPRPPDSGLELATSPICTLMVFEDQTYLGCDEPVRQFESKDSLAPEFETGRLLSAAAEHAVSLMRAWRTKRLDGIFDRALRIGGAVSADIDFLGDEPRAYRIREATTRALRAHFEETASIDSMACEIVNDSSALSGGVLMMRFWIARSLRERDHAAAGVVDRIDYHEWWLSGNTLLGFEEVDANRWEGDARPIGGAAFPRRHSAVAARAR